MNARPNAVLAVVAGTVVALAILAGILTATRPAPDIDPTTPDGVVQLYILAITDGDYEEALTYLDPSLGCTDDDEMRYGPMRSSITIVRTSIDGDEASVVADLTEYQDMMNSWDHRETFDLKRSGDGWLLVGSPEGPWPIYRCK